ncbi:DUF3558 domain-containing protein [Nocardia sp. NPDC127579]|uniref:DUF3558 domain-containing protein n=1 Tax=Nocardia sp. NPDC127579 TaxID=3345402 RepID=UPI0036445180
MGRRTTAATALVALAALAAGCDSTGGGGGPSSTTAAPAAIWDPCTQISDQVLSQQIGLDPATKESGILGVEEPGWKICSWNNNDYALGVFSSPRTVEEYKQKPDNIDFVDVTIGGRKGVRYDTKSDKDNKTCDITFPAQQGSFTVTISNRVSSKNKVDPCTRAQAAAEALVPLWPK